VRSYLGRVGILLLLMFVVGFSGTWLFAQGAVEAAPSRPAKINLQLPTETNTPMGARLGSLLGMAVLIGLAVACSTNYKAIDWRLVGWGIGLQLLFAVLILQTGPGKTVFLWFKAFFEVILGFTNEGASFVFGDLANPGGSLGMLFAFNILPTIIFFSSLMAVCFHLGLVQFVVKWMAWIMMRTMGTSGAESLSSAANVFVGQTEAPLIVRPYVEDMTVSELNTLMVGGLATVAGGVMAAYAGMGISPGHLLSASVMSAPAALLMSKILLPEEDVPKTRGEVNMDIPKVDVNVIDAAARGAGEGLQLALNVGAMLMAFISLVAMANYVVLGVFGCNLEQVFGWVFSPLAFVMGVPWKECTHVGTLMGLKTVLNEFVAYAKLSEWLQPGSPICLSPRSVVISTYALCGFSNFSSIAIQLGGLGAMAPSRRHDLAKLGIRALIGGSLACFMTATIAGMIM